MGEGMKGSKDRTKKGNGINIYTYIHIYIHTSTYMYQKEEVFGEEGTQEEGRWGA